MPAAAGAAGPPSSRTKPPDVRRDELMNAGERLFLENGMAATSVDQIVAAADVAKGTFYLYFPSKDDLLIALQQRYVVRHAEHLQAAVERRRADDWAGRLDAWIEAGIDFYFQHLRLHDLVFHEFRSEGHSASHDNLAFGHLAGLLQDGVIDQACAVEDTFVTAAMLFHALHGLLDETVHTDPEVNRRRLAHAAKAFFRRAVGLA